MEASEGSEFIGVQPSPHVKNHMFLITVFLKVAQSPLVPVYVPSVSTCNVQVDHDSK